jgi:hypothetical protein
MGRLEVNDRNTVTPLTLFVSWAITIGIVYLITAALR